MNPRDLVLRELLPYLFQMTEILIAESCMITLSRSASSCCPAESPSKQSPNLHFFVDPNPYVSGGAMMFCRAKDALLTLIVSYHASLSFISGISFEN